VGRKYITIFLTEVITKTKAQDLEIKTPHEGEYFLLRNIQNSD